MIGGRDGLIIDWCDGSKLARVSEGELCDAVLKWAAAPDRSSNEMMAWWQMTDAQARAYGLQPGSEDFQRNTAPTISNLPEYTAAIPR